MKGGGCERCDHLCKKPAHCRVKRPPGRRDGARPHTRPPAFKLPAARGDAWPGPAPLYPAKPLLIEVQPPVGPSQRDPGKRSVLNNYYVT